jgi:hypothetical protein
MAKSSIHDLEDRLARYRQVKISVHRQQAG